ncbi:MAG: UDP-N-acetylmuramoyl-L-alanine--D-glutamate ligase, partial [Lactobacillaceae bacterium]|nr:UDP-N-acetylmuramoyl-L-alanine--D-glutamate ligase [Lactobacillaceae bacterium]
VEHRLEFVGDFNGRKIYNDSKATDIEATQSALDSFPDDDIFWIAGGLDRGDDFSKLIPNLKKVSKAVFIGETKNKLLDVALKININDVQIADNLGEAVNIASKNSKTNQIILFSPAAASWDQYPNFEIRGEEFKKMVNGVNW